MTLTPEQKQAKQDRNERIRKDHTAGMRRAALAKKYSLSPESIYNICKDTIKDVNREEPELTEGEQKIRDRYKNFNYDNEIGKALAIRYYDLELTVHPKIYKEHFSQIIFR